MQQKKINPLSRDLGNALLQRHQRLCSAMPKRYEDVTEADITVAIISYKNLLISIGAPETLAVSIGKYLYEIAEWCTGKGHPPVNALAVNGVLHSPGAGYYLAPGGDVWAKEIRECIVHDRYPPSISN